MIPNHRVGSSNPCGRAMRCVPTNGDLHVLNLDRSIEVDTVRIVSDSITKALCAQIAIQQFEKLSSF